MAVGLATAPRVLDLGCGANKVPGSIGLDRAAIPGVDVVYDLERTPYPFADCSFDTIHMNHVIEHVLDPLRVLDEVWRVGANGARIYIKTPHFSSFYAWADPTHRRAFSYRTFDYLVEDSAYGYYSRAKFRIVDRQLLYLLPYPHPGDEYLRPLRPFTRLLDWAANRHPFVCERFWCYLVGGFGELRATLEVVK